MIIAVFGDVHGEINLVYKSCRDWQKKAKKPIDLILQVGDIGILSEAEKQKVTKKRSPSELELYNALNEQYVFDTMLAGNDCLTKISAKILFTAGNHDDPSQLENAVKESPNESIHPINDHILYLEDGKPVELFADDGERVKVGSLGGIEPYQRPNKFKKDPRIGFLAKDVTNAISCQDVDIFMTHMHPAEAGFNGSKQLSELVDVIKPKFYFFGHIKQGSRFKIGDSQCYGLQRVRYKTSENIKDGSMVVIEKFEGKYKIVDNID